MSASRSAPKNALDDAEPSVPVVCPRCRHDFDVALTSLVSSNTAPCPRCKHACDPFEGQGVEVGNDEASTLRPPPKVHKVLVAIKCESCGQPTEIAPEDMLAKVALCDACQSAADATSSETEGRLTMPCAPTEELLAKTRSKSRPPLPPPRPAKK